MISYLKIKKQNWLFILSFFWLLFYFFPTLNLGLLGDDAFNAQIRGKLLDENISFFQWYTSEFYGWMKGAGRIFPLAGHYAVISYINNDILFIRLFIYLTFVFSIIFLIKFLTKIFKDNIFFLSLFLIILTSNINFRSEGHDPFISFFGKMSIIYIFLFYSLILYDDFLKFKEKKKFFLSILFYIIQVLIYEISYLNFIFYFIVYFNNKNLNLKNILSLKILIFLLISLIMIILSFILKTKFSPFYIFSEVNFNNTYPGAEFSLKYFFGSLKNSILSTFPFYENYNLFNNNITEISKIGKNFLFQVLGAFDLYKFITIFFIFIFLREVNLKFDFYYLEIQSIHFKQLLNYILIGFFLIVSQSAIISLSRQWQYDFYNNPIGFVYMNHFGQVLGLSLIICTCSIFILKILRTKIILKILINLFLIIFFIISVYSFSKNQNFIVSSNKLYKKPSILVKEAIEEGLFENVNENSIIIYKNMLPNDWYWFNASISNKIYEFCEIEQLYLQDKCLNKKYYFKNVEKNILKDVKNYQIFGYRYFFKDNIGYVELYKISKIYFNEDKTIFFSDEKQVFNNFKKIITTEKFEEMNITNYFTHENNSLNEKNILKKIYIN